MGYSNKKLRSKSRSRLRSRSTLRSKRNKKTKGGSLPGLEGDTLTLTKDLLTNGNRQFRKEEYKEKIKTIEADDTVTEIPDSLFDNEFKRYFHSLKTVNFSKAKNLTVIGTAAFFNCVNLEKVILPEEMSVENCAFVIKDAAFRKCTGLTEIVMPATKNVIMPCKDTFLGCRNLSTLRFYKNDYFIYPFSIEKEANLTSRDSDKEISNSFNINRLPIRDTETLEELKVFHPGAPHGINAYTLAQFMNYIKSETSDCSQLKNEAVCGGEHIPCIWSKSKNKCRSKKNCIMISKDRERCDKHRECKWLVKTSPSGEDRSRCGVNKYPYE